MFAIRHPSSSNRHVTLQDNSRGGCVTPVVSVAKNLPIENNDAEVRLSTVTANVSISRSCREYDWNHLAYWFSAASMDG
jgi:hypothetical protein